MVVSFQDFTCGWSKIVTGSGPHIQLSNLIEITIPDSSQETGSGYFGAALRLNSALSGDFDVQVDYILNAWPSNNGVRVGLTGGRPAVSRVSGWSSREVYLTDFSDGIFDIPSSDQKGALRIERVEKDVTGYYFDPSTNSWKVIHAASIPVSGPQQLSVAAWSHNASFTHQKVFVTFNRIIINKGTLVCPT